MNSQEQQLRDSVVAEAFSCRHALLAYAYASLGDHSAAEDVVQNSFLVVMNKYSDFQEGTSMIAWCRSIVRLKIFETLRERRRLVTTEDHLLYDAIAFAFEDAQAPEQAAVRNERLERLRVCVSKLPAKSRRLLEVSMRPGTSYAEIARLAIMKVEAVRKALYRIRQTLRDCVSGGDFHTTP